MMELTLFTSHIDPRNSSSMDLLTSRGLLPVKFRDERSYYTNFQLMHDTNLEVGIEFYNIWFKESLVHLKVRE